MSEVPDEMFQSYAARLYDVRETADKKHKWRRVGYQTPPRYDLKIGTGKYVIKGAHTDLRGGKL
jgi:hypothetical protein